MLVKGDTDWQISLMLMVAVSSAHEPSFTVETKAAGDVHGTGKSCRVMLSWGSNLLPTCTSYAHGMILPSRVLFLGAIPTRQTSISSMHSFVL